MKDVPEKEDAEFTAMGSGSEAWKEFKALARITGKGEDWWL